MKHKKCKGTGWLAYRTRLGPDMDACECLSAGICPACGKEDALLSAWEYSSITGGKTHISYYHTCGYDSRDGELQALDDLTKGNYDD